MLIIGFVCRFALFREILDAEMKHATKSGIVVACTFTDNQEGMKNASIIRCLGVITVFRG